jgi:hypothetical protein
MSELDKLKYEVKSARSRFLEMVSSFSFDQGLFKPAPDVWSAAEITEHLVHAEFGGIVGMWKAIDGLRKNDPPWKEKHTNIGLSIEEIVERTWKPREKVPEGAGPRMGGPLVFWADALRSCQAMLERLADELKDKQLQTIVYPHPISGPLDAGQRFEFLRFHMDRHRDQVERLKQHVNFPKS